MKSYILLDRSGSMQSNWAETLGAINGYVANIDRDTKVTLAVFDSVSFDVLRDGVKAKNWRHLTNDEANPRGMTPLFDAIGKLGNIVDAKKAAIVILTDGAENASVEMSKDTARLVIVGWRARGYDVSFIGADFDAFSEARGLGLGYGQTMNVSKGKMAETMAVSAQRTNAYAATGQAQSFSDEDREKTK